MATTVYPGFLGTKSRLMPNAMKETNKPLSRVSINKITCCHDVIEGRNSLARNKVDKEILYATAFQYSGKSGIKSPENDNLITVGLLILGSSRIPRCNRIIGTIAHIINKPKSGLRIDSPYFEKKE